MWVLDVQRACDCPLRPEPRASDRGRVWECDFCGRRWGIHVFDVGYPDEIRDEATATWRSVGNPTVSIEPGGNESGAARADERERLQQENLDRIRVTLPGWESFRPPPGSPGDAE